MEGGRNEGKNGGRQRGREGGRDTGLMIVNPRTAEPTNLANQDSLIWISSGSGCHRDVRVARGMAIAL